MIRIVVLEDKNDQSTTNETQTTQESPRLPHMFKAKDSMPIFVGDLDEDL